MDFVINFIAKYFIFLINNFNKFVYRVFKYKYLINSVFGNADVTHTVVIQYICISG